MKTLSKHAALKMRKSPRLLITENELYHILNSKPLRADGQYLENCISQNFGECDKKGEPVENQTAWSKNTVKIEGKLKMNAEKLAKIESVKIWAVKFWAVAALGGCALLFCLVVGEIVAKWGM